MVVLSIAGRRIGGDAPCFIIAEAGVNHNGSLEWARALVDMAADAGADAVKFQTFRSDNLVSPQAPKAAYQEETTGSGESQLDMIRRLELPLEAFAELKAHCERRGVLFLSTPFDEDSLDGLDALGMAAIKIPSGEITNLPFLTRIAAKGRPVILSTGMARLAEVDDAVRALRAAGCEALAVLHCVSDYPAAAADANLRAMDTLAAAFGVPIGYSDHTLGLEVALAAVARGACILEKHVTLDKTLPGPDHRASLDGAEFAALTRGVRAVQSALGHGRKEPAAAEAAIARVARRSLFLRRAVPAGGTITLDDLIALRPGDGVPPALAPQVAGRRAARSLNVGERIDWSDLS